MISCSCCDGNWQEMMRWHAPSGLSSGCDELFKCARTWSGAAGEVFVYKKYHWGRQFDFLRNSLWVDNIRERLPRKTTMGLFTMSRVEEFIRIRWLDAILGAFRNWKIVSLLEMVTNSFKILVSIKLTHQDVKNKEIASKCLPGNDLMEIKTHWRNKPRQSKHHHEQDNNVIAIIVGHLFSGWMFSRLARISWSINQISDKTFVNYWLIGLLLSAFSSHSVMFLVLGKLKTENKLRVLSLLTRTRHRWRLLMMEGSKHCNHSVWEIGS